MTFFITKTVNVMIVSLLAGVLWFIETPGNTLWQTADFIIKSGVGVAVLTLLKLAYNHDQQTKEIRRGINLLMSDLFERRPEMEKMWVSEREEFSNRKSFKAKAGQNG